MKRKFKICYTCKKKILENERYCSLLSHEKGKVMHEDHWHAQCFIEWINAAVERKMKSAYTQSFNLIKDIAKTKGLNLPAF